MVDAIPQNYPRLMAYVIMRGAARAIDFYTSVFGATERGRMPGPNDTIGHAELDFGGSVLMLADEPDASAQTGYRSPRLLGGTSFGFVLYVEDCDDVYKRAIDSGATMIREPQTEFYGDREGRVRDPFGYVWSIMTHVEDVSPEEMQKRAAAAAQNA
jgi:PhnB protein